MNVCYNKEKEEKRDERRFEVTPGECTSMQSRRWFVPRPHAAEQQNEQPQPAVVLQRLIDSFSLADIQSNMHFLFLVVSGGSRAAMMASSNTFFNPF